MISRRIVNFDFTFDHKATGTTATVSLGAAGPFVFLVDRAGPDLYEYPPLQLNFVATQRLGPLAPAPQLPEPPQPENIWTYGDSKSDPIYSEFTLGTTLAMILSYEY